MDNLGAAHRSPSRDALRAPVAPFTYRNGQGPHRRLGAELRFLPPYSPDLKLCARPVHPDRDGPFSKFKARARLLKRRAARRYRHIELWESIGHATDIFTPDECQNYFAAAGYDRV